MHEVADWRLLEVRDGLLEVSDVGAGEPVVVVPTALTADELVPLARRLAAGGGHRVVTYHRRGYAGSSPPLHPSSVGADAADLAALLEALGAAPAHVVGASYSGAVALELALTRPELVLGLVLAEPPPVFVPAAPDFRAACLDLVAAHRASPEAALERIGTLTGGPAWRADLEHVLPGAVADLERDAPTFFEADLPALLAWDFTEDDAREIAVPVLHVGGSASGPWFREVREHVTAWFPGAEGVVVEGAGHTLAVTHTDEVAGAIASFLARHATTPTA
ncbi:alpha/beta fold hydrolase [Oryzobacter sp. R7]|uniref:alpha/beta fold hydrolase n=1 Tax=Oryzobacter faecalis TaxID=3388656 RepID=UPI00398D3651